MPVKRYFKSLDKVISILNCFTEDRPELRTSEVSQILGIHRVTAHRLLETLSEARLLEKVRSRGAYTVGPELYRLGTVYLHNTSMNTVAAPVVKKISKLTGEVVAIHILDKRGHVQVLMRGERKNGFRWSAQVGSILPAYACAGGKALLSELTEVEIDNLYAEERLKRLTAGTISTKTQLKTELETIRVKGVAFNHGEDYEGIEAVASVIHDVTGKAEASLIIAAPLLGESRIQREQWDKLVKLGASLISYQFGYRNDNLVVRNLEEMVFRWEQHE